MAARQMADEGIDSPQVSHRDRNGVKRSTDASISSSSSSLPRSQKIPEKITPRSGAISVHDGSSSSSSSLPRSQEIPEKITPRSGAISVRDGSLSLHHSKEAPSSNISRYRLNSGMSPVVTRPSDVGNRRFSQNTASSTNRMAANGLIAHHNLQQKSHLSPRPCQTAKGFHYISSEDRTASLDRTSEVSLKPIASPSTSENRRSSSGKPSIKGSPLTEAIRMPLPHGRLAAKSLSSKPTRATSEIEKLRDKERLKGHTDAKDPAAKIKKPAEMLCKECKTRAMAPVCFINNDGKISAGVMHRFHYCKKPECAANRKNFQSAVSNPRKATISKSPSPHIIARHPAKYESHNVSNNESHNFAKPGVYCPSICSDISSVRESDDNCESQVAIQMNEASTNLGSSENDDVQQTGNILSSNGISHHHQTEQLNDTSSPDNGKVILDDLPHDENLRCLSSSSNEENQKTGGETTNNEVETITPTATSCTSSDIFHPHEGEDNSPHEREDRNPHEGEDSNPHEGEDNSPHKREGEDNNPHEGEDNSPHKREDSNPHEGEDINPHEGEDNSPHEGEENIHNLSSAEQDAIDELHGFKAYSYQGDNEYSCSEDGTDTAITPISSSTGAFDDYLLTHDGEKHLQSLAQHSAGGPSMAKMRQRYLESLGEQEAETVRLRKQEIMARKQAGDWMLDCHMEELMHRLAPGGEARVKALVEAFESVIHHSDSETSQTHHQEYPLQMHGQQEELQVENIHSDASP